MSIHNFTTDLSGIYPPAAAPAQFPVAINQLSDIQAPVIGTRAGKQGRTDILATKSFEGLDREDINSFIMPGFYALDQAMKMYWSDIRVPTRDSYRFMRVKISGGDRAVLVWREDLVNGRASYPVAGLSRHGEAFNKDKFNPPYLPMSVRFNSGRGNRGTLIYRPVPWNVEYTMITVSESKRDAEFIHHQILTRFNPLAEFVMFDGHLRGTTTIHLLKSNDVTDKEAGHDKSRILKYEYGFRAESWLPLPERIVPLVLGQITSLRDQDGTTLATVNGNSWPLGGA